MTSKYLNLIMVSLITLVHTCTFAQGFEPFGDNSPKVEKTNDDESKLIDIQKNLFIGKYTEAITALEQLVKIDKKNVTYLYQLTKAYDAKRDPINADKYLQQALQYGGDNYWLLDYAAEKYISQSKYTLAIPLLEKLAIESVTRDYYYLDMLIDAGLSQGDAKAAEKTLAFYETKIGPTAALLTRKLRLYQDRDASLLLATVQQLIALQPDNKQYLKVLAKHYIKTGEDTKANEVYIRILDIDPNDTEANVARLMTTTDTGVGTNAYLRTLVPLVKNNSIPIDDKIKELMPYLTSFVEKGDTVLGASLQSLGESLTLAHPKDAKSYAFMADTYLGGSNYALAIKYYKKALALDDTKYSVWQQLMNCLELINDYDALYVISQEAVDLFPNQVEAYILHTTALNHRKAYKDAISISQEAVMIAAGNNIILSKVYTSQAIGFLGLMKLDDAAKAIDLALTTSNNKNPIAYEVLGDIFSAKGLKEEALKAYQTSRQMGNNRASMMGKTQ